MISTAECDELRASVALLLSLAHSRDALLDAPGSSHSRAICGLYLYEQPCLNSQTQTQAKTQTQKMSNFILDFDF